MKNSPPPVLDIDPFSEEFLAAANRDERRWRDPDIFDVTRNAAGHVAFGHGIHACLGQMVARMEADVLLTVMSERVKQLLPMVLPSIA